MNPEQILVTNAAPFNMLSAGNDYIFTGSVAIECLRNIKVELRERNDDLEKNEAFRQLIVYALIEDQQTGEFLHLQRASQSEKRLDGKKHLGVGGHINSEDYDKEATIFAIILDAVWRESKEEVGLKQLNFSTQFLQGLIVASSSLVTKVHLGILYHVLIPSKEFINLDGPETQKHNAKWIKIEELLSELSRNRELWWEYEGWTQMLFEQYFNIRKP